MHFMIIWDFQRRPLDELGFDKLSVPSTTNNNFVWSSPQDWNLHHTWSLQGEFDLTRACHPLTAALAHETWIVQSTVAELTCAQVTQATGDPFIVNKQ